MNNVHIDTLVITKILLYLIDHPSMGILWLVLIGCDNFHDPLTMIYRDNHGRPKEDCFIFYFILGFLICPLWGLSR